MTKMVNVIWKEEMLLIGNNERGQSITLEAPEKAGGQGRGFIPSELLLVALGGCTSMDVLSLLKKYGASITSLQVELSGTKRREHPKAFADITAVYKLEGDITPEQALRALNSSYKKYSVVANSLCATVKYQVLLNGREVVTDS